ncbi:NrfD/PsrC family molybdoenzyme membrane anchor subunit [Desertibaculum subflavum]|uniref:NrfD/PsrC family molybdoenzyme membrane anchor subunit n=1 Tax=Desertibaculum subflavum TaxID=2268458 RepID=UPI000E669628
MTLVQGGPNDHALPSRPNGTYYDLPQVKAAPFKSGAVGTYVFLAGLSGASALFSALLSRRRRRYGDSAIRRADALSMLAPTLGAGLLIYDLKTPQRFYNMLRIFRPSSPMSIGSWLLVGFGGAATAASAGEMLGRHMKLGWLRHLGACFRVPAALTGVGLATYTGSLFAATSTPRWAAAPKSLSVQFGASSVASAATALAFAEPRSDLRRSLDLVAGAALAVELAAAQSARRAYRAAGIQADGPMPIRDQLGTLLPLGLIAASAVCSPGPQRTLSRLACLAVLGGSLAMRIQTIEAGKSSAADPRVSLRLARRTHSAMRK